MKCVLVNFKICSHAVTRQAKKSDALDKMKFDGFILFCFVSPLNHFTAIEVYIAVVFPFIFKRSNPSEV